MDSLFLGKTTSMIPLIILVLGEFCSPDTGRHHLEDGRLKPSLKSSIFCPNLGNRDPKAACFRQFLCRQAIHYGEIAMAHQPGKLFFHQVPVRQISHHLVGLLHHTRPAPELISVFINSRSSQFS